jgi:hypothetical protein
MIATYRSTTAKITQYAAVTYFSAVVMRTTLAAGGG